jgi:hypothetical protein
MFLLSGVKSRDGTDMTMLVSDFLSCAIVPMPIKHTDQHHLQFSFRTPIMPATVFR